MLKVIGFLLEFKNKASKGIEKITKDTLHLDKVWMKGSKTMKGWTKAMGAQFDTLKAKTTRFFMDSKAGIFDFSSALERMEEVFGVRARRIVEALMSPKGAILAFGAASLKAGMDFEKVTRRMSIQTGATADDMEKFGAIAQEVAYEIGTGFDQTASVMGILAERMGLSEEGAEKLAKTAMRSARISGVEVEAIIEGMLEMHRVLGYDADKMEEVMAGTVGVAQATRRNIGEVMRETLAYTKIITQVPKEWQKATLPALVQIQGALGDTFIEAGPVIAKVLRGITVRTSEEFTALRSMMSFGGREAMIAFDEAIQEHDVEKAMRAVLQAVKDMPLDEEFKEMSSAMTGVLGGFDMDTLDRLKKVSATAMDESIAAYKAAANEAGFLARIDEEHLITTQRMVQLWNRFQVILVPIGQILVKIGHALLTAVEWVLDGIKAIMEIPILGDFIKWAAVTAIIAVVITGIVVVVKILFAIFAGVVGAVIAAVAPFLVIAAIVVAIVAVVWLLWDVIVAVGEVVWAILRPLYEVVRFIVFAVAGAILGIGYLIWDNMIKPVVDFVAPAFWVVVDVLVAIGKAVGAIGKWIYDSIIKPIWDFVVGTFNKVEEFSDWLSGAAGETFSFLTFGLFDEEAAPGAAGGGMVMPSPGGSLMNVAEGGQPEIIADPALMRKIIGADDIIDAIWGAAEMIVTRMLSPVAQTGPGVQSQYSAPATFATEFASPTSYDQ